MVDAAYNHNPASAWSAGITGWFGNSAIDLSIVLIGLQTGCGECGGTISCQTEKSDVGVRKKFSEIGAFRQESAWSVVAARSVIIAAKPLL